MEKRPQKAEKYNEKKIKDSHSVHKLLHRGRKILRYILKCYRSDFWQESDYTWAEQQFPSSLCGLQTDFCITKKDQSTA